MSLHRDLFFAIRDAQHQADSLLWSGTERGIRYQGEADGLRRALRIINEHRAREWEAEQAARQVTA